MANSTFTKLIAMASAVATIGTVAFEFTPYSSQNSLIKQGVDSLKAMVQGKDEALAKLQAEYDEVMANLNNANQSLETARAKLQAIYQKITGQAWDEANGDILNFDFNTLIKDGDQFESNVDGNAICDVLGLPHGSSTQQIIVAIQNLQEQIADLAQQVQNLQAQVAELQAEIATYKEEESQLVLDLQQQISDLKARAESEANAIIEQANDEEQEQLDYINGVINELENPEQEVPEEEPGEDETPVSEYVEFELVGDWSQATEAQKTLLINTLNSFNIKNDSNIGPVEVTCNRASYSEYSKVIDVTINNEEVYNIITSHELYSSSGFRFNSSGQMVSNNAYSSLTQINKGNTIKINLKTN